MPSRFPDNPWYPERPKNGPLPNSSLSWWTMWSVGLPGVGVPHISGHLQKLVKRWEGFGTVARNGWDAAQFLAYL